MEQRNGIRRSLRVLKRTPDNISSATDASPRAKKRTPSQVPGNQQLSIISKRDGSDDTDIQDEQNENAIAQQGDGYLNAPSVSPPKTVVNNTNGNSEIKVNRDHLNFNGNQNHTNGDHLHVGQLLNISGPVYFNGGELNESLQNWNAESSPMKILEDKFKELERKVGRLTDNDKYDEPKSSLKTEVRNAQDLVDDDIDSNALRRLRTLEIIKELKAAHLAKQQLKELKGEFKELEREVGSGTDNADKDEEHESSLLTELCYPQQYSMYAGEGGIDFSAACFKSPESASYDGMHVCKITDFSRLKKDALSGKDVSRLSKPFYTSLHGYKMCAQLCLDVVDGSMGKDVNASLSFVIMQGEHDAVLPWPFKQKVTLILLDQDTGQHHLSQSFQPDPNSSSFQRPATDVNIVSDLGCPLHIDHQVFEDSTYLKDDVIFVKVKVDTRGLESSDEIKKMIKPLQDNQDMMGDRLKRVERGGLGCGSRAHQLDEETDRMARESGGSNARPESVENLNGMHAACAARLAEYDNRFQVLETANYEGVLLWKIKDFARRKRGAGSSKTSSLYSQPFYTSRYGYKMCAQIYFNGDGMGKKKHASLFFVVMRGDYDVLLPWPFRQKVTLMLLAQDTRQHHLSQSFQPDPNSSSFKRPATDMNIASGCPLHIDHKVFEDSTYLKDDVIFVKVKVDTTELEC